MSLPPSSKKIKLNGSLLENPREITAVITHASCPDGTGCIFVLFYYFKTMGIDLSNVFFTSLNHSDVKTKSNKLQSVESNLKGKNLVICDFNFPKAYYEEIKSLCNKVITVDHHEDAVPELEDDVTFYFDVEECGTTLLWKWLRDKDKEFRSKTPEMLLILKYIRDRDLWKWEMPYSKAVNSYMYFKSNVESLLEDFYEKSDEEASKIIAAYSDQGDIMISLIKWITDQSSNFGKKKTFLGMDCYLVEATQFVSETGETVLEKKKSCRVALMWKEDTFNNQWKISARGRIEDTSLDLGKMFRQLNIGGGHKLAAGITVSKDKYKNVDFFIEEYTNIPKSYWCNEEDTNIPKK